MKRLSPALIAATLSLLLAPIAAFASGGHHDLDGSVLTVAWALPFACMLLSIAVMPLALPHFWHHHFGKVSAFWALAFLVPCAAVFGMQTAIYQVLHTFLLEYVPFLILLFALFTVAGGVRLKGSLVGTPVVNTAILAVGTLLASWMGTTGAAMLLIRPLLRANSHRRFRVHSVVFFIFLVANIGGSLTPLGDPPLFLGFLKGVSFFWTTSHLLMKTILVSVILIAAFFVLDTVLFNREGRPVPPNAESGEKLGLDGVVNLPLLGGVVALVLMSGLWKPEVAFNVYGIEVELQNLARDLGLLGIAALSLKLTSTECRRLNEFTRGSHRGSRQALRGHLREHDSRHRHPQGWRSGRTGTGHQHGDPRRAAREHHVLLADRHPVQLPRQRPHLPRVLQHGWWRRHAPHERHPRDPRRHLRRRGVHGRQHLHRQRAQLHGAFHRRRTGRAHAQLLRLHGMVVRHSRPVLHPRDVALLHVAA